MSTLSIEERVATLEAEVVKLRQKVESPAVPVTPWWEKIAGTFAQDSVYHESYEIGSSISAIAPPSISPKTQG